MNYKNTLILLLLIGSISVLNVNALDIDNTGLTNNRGNQIFFSVSNFVSALFSTDVSGNFTNLDEAIESSGGNVRLVGDIKLSEDEEDTYRDGIIIDHDLHDLVLDGQGHTIDARGLARIFQVTGGSITIKNTNLINGYAYDDIGNGAAIYTKNSNVTVIDSKFNNNTAMDPDMGYGGAIYAGSGSVSVSGSSFTNNTANVYGGAIHAERGGVSVSGSSFTNNTANKYGGAIYTGGVSVTGSSFINNIVSDRGGAIYTSSGVNVTDSIFNNNTAKNYGGSINSLGDVNVIDSNFTNSNTNIWGGAIYTNHPVSVTGSNFNNNTASMDGSGRGGAIYTTTHVTVTGSSFNNNMASYAAGAISSFSGVVSVTDSSFNNNTAKTNNGGAVCADYGSVSVTGNSIFTKNTASNTTNDTGGAIYVGGNVTCRIGVVFKDNIPNDCNKPIDWIGDGLSFTDLANEIKNSNYVTLTGDVVLSDAEKDAFKDGININHNLILDGQGHTIDARGLVRIFKITESTVTIKNIKLINGKGDLGGAIFTNHDKISLFNCTLSNNKVDSNGGGIYSNCSDLNITTGLLSDNKISGNTGDNGGAINNHEGVLTITDSVLDSNFAVPGDGNWGQHGCGGAIDNFKGVSTITNTRLSNNNARFGGAINSYYATLTTNNCTIVNNRANIGGGICSNMGTQNIDSETTNKFSGNTPNNHYHFYG
ncbi:MAG: hypothetical protein LBR15_11025 [Methanobrevibacter sp.]|jgi:predicted outer membrane repeat protein|nr:hypothetical protein [Candidatus Methanovirga australis]